MLFQQYQNEFRPIYRDLQNAVSTISKQIKPIYGNLQNSAESFRSTVFRKGVCSGNFTRQVHILIANDRTHESMKKHIHNFITHMSFVLKL